MKTQLRNLLPVVVTTIVCILVEKAQAQPGKPTESQIPDILMQDVPLTAAIDTLGRQAGTNFMIDPKITNARGTTTLVTFRWERITAMDALARLLKEHGLFLVENPQTGVAKVAMTNSPPKALDREFFDGSKDVIPLINMSSVALDAALSILAKQAKVELKFDGNLWAPSKPMGGPDFVSVRFENRTAAQALAAICDVYDLQITKSDLPGVWSVSRAQ